MTPPSTSQTAPVTHANFLLLHASTDGMVRMTQQEIASHLGTTREVVARALGQLGSAGHVRTGRGQIALTDAVKLARELKAGIDGEAIP